MLDLLFLGYHVQKFDANVMLVPCLLGESAEMIQKTASSQNVYKTIFQNLLQNGKCCVRITKLDVR